MSRLAILLALAVLASCATPRKEALDRISARYMGKPAAEFFSAHGAAIKTENGDAGRTLYLWDARAIDRPVHLESQRDYERDVAMMKQAGIAGLECQLIIESDSAGKITQIKIAMDTLGRASMSRCAEVFP